MDFSSILATVFLILSCAGTRSEGLVIVNGNDPGKCNQTNHGREVLVQNRENNELIIFCTKNNGLYKWTTIGGKTPIGELFSPAYDCSKILDHNSEAKDGMYWIHLGGIYPKQAYCDMITDGGGYMLIGRTNNSVTWTVPSSNNAVEPYGNPHWASHLGDAPILDFRIQMAKTEDLSKTLAHWSFRLQAERLLKNLMIVDHGCAQATPGIGNIAYVKDLQTENIVTTTFRCSVFGGYHGPTTGFGWSMMNSCLKKPCRRGFAFFDHDVIKFQTDHSGSFSYSVSGPISGIYQNSTAFVGCDKNKCCGCFGPVGGTDNYCGTDCKKRRGGTIIKNVYTWFWVRSSIPKKVWNKCMDYKETTANGDTIRYKLLDGNPTPEKGRCGRKEALLNDGIVVVPDGETAKKVPAVPGLLKYRKDTKELYVRANESWCVVAQEKKILNQLETEKRELKRELSGMKQVIQNMNETLNSLLSIVKDSISFAESDILSGEIYYNQLLQSWIERSFAAKLCWRATRDGWAASTFHSNCDSKKPTVTLVKVGRYIFGGYATESWEGSLQFKKAPGSFIFSLRNKENLPPFKAPLKDQNTPLAIRAVSSYGPIFGNGYDIHISDNAASNTRSYTNFKYQYQAPSGVNDRTTILAGTYEFTPSEVEVFYLV